MAQRILSEMRGSLMEVGERRGEAGSTLLEMADQGAPVGRTHQVLLQALSSALVSAVNLQWGLGLSFPAWKPSS